MAEGLYGPRPPKTRKLCECGRDRYRDPVTARWEQACRFCLELEWERYELDDAYKFQEDQE